MLKHLLTVFILCASINAIAQSQPPVLNEKTIVKDSTGKVLPYEYWQKAMHSGNYSLRSTYRQKDTTHVLRYLTAEEKQRFAGMRPPSATAPIAMANNNAAPLTQLRAMPEMMPPQPEPSEVFPIGATMNMLSTRDMDGKRIDNKSLAGKIVVMNFWFIGCPPCRAEIPELNQLSADYAANPDIVFIAIGLDERWQIKDFTKKMPFNYRHVPEGGRFATGYGVTLYPTNVIVDRKGVIRYSAVSYNADRIKWMRKTLDDIKAEN